MYEVSEKLVEKSYLGSYSNVIRKPSNVKRA